MHYAAETPNPGPFEVHYICSCGQRFRILSDGVPDLLLCANCGRECRTSYGLERVIERAHYGYRKKGWLFDSDWGIIRWERAPHQDLTSC